MTPTPFDPVLLLRSALSGLGVHISPEHVLVGIDWKVAGERPAGAPHTIFQIVNHLTFWQDLFLSGLARAQMSAPSTAAAGWPGTDRPTSSEEWDRVITQFQRGRESVLAAIEADDPMAGIPAHEPTKRVNVINTIATHTSYHLGQIVLLRRQLGAWPPPQGAHTW